MAPHRPVLPSGEQVELRHGDRRATVVELGGALRAYAVGAWEVLDGYAADEMCTGARGESLIPWPNRLRDGRYAFAGQAHQLPLSEPERGNAIHGLVRWTRWAVGERTEDAVTMELEALPQAGYPFALRLALAYRLDATGLTVTLHAENVGSGPCPFGAGAHPYLAVGTPTIDGATVRAPGRRRMLADDRGIPVGREPVDGTIYDLRAPRAIDGLELDTGYSDLERDADGRARVELWGPGGEPHAALWLEESYSHLMLFTGDSFPQPERRRRGLGIEPMTCAPNALADGDGLRVLAPGESFSGSWGIEA